VNAIEKLLATIDGLSMSGGLDPGMNARAIHDSWKLAKPEHWARLGVLAGQRPPGPAEQGEVLRALLERAARGRAA
jgi:hypothetical protein